MTPNRILEDDELGSPVSSERPTTPAGGKALAAISRHRVLLGSCGIAIVAVLAWQWAVSGESTPVVPDAGPGAAHGPERELEIIVLGVHDAVAAVAPAAAPRPPTAVALPAAAPEPESVIPPITPVSSPARPNPAPRSGPARASSSSAAKASPAPVAAAKAGPAPEPRVEIAPAKPQPKPDGPPMETNPYVYK